jgi:hypothetical protein
VIGCNRLAVQDKYIIGNSFFKQSLHHVSGIDLPFKRIEDKVFMNALKIETVCLSGKYIGFKKRFQYFVNE